MPSPERIPRAMAEKFSALTALTDAFCEHLDDEYRALIHRVIEVRAMGLDTEGAAGRRDGVPARAVQKLVDDRC